MKYQTGAISNGNTGLSYFLYVIFILSLEWKPCIFYWILSFYSTLFILLIEIDIFFYFLYLLTFGFICSCPFIFFLNFFIFYF
ncbi:hypothetical protein PPACK8108_LOCUS17760, partial [Phakopsora pachyrhizi]